MQNKGSFHPNAPWFNLCIHHIIVSCNAVGKDESCRNQNAKNNSEVADGRIAVLVQIRISGYYLPEASSGVVNVN